MELGRVFISSVFGGMLDLRRKAAESARLIGLEPVETAHHVAQASAVEGTLGREIANCDTYIGVFDKRRGTIPPGTGDRAITEEEFRLARELGLRCLVFFSTADSEDREPGLQDFLEKEVGDYRTGVWARPYADPASLTKEIAAALSASRPRVVLALRPALGALASLPANLLEGRQDAGAPRGMQATLHLGALKPAWTGDAVLGPVALDLDLSTASLEVFRKFQSEPRSRNELKEEAVRYAGAELARQAFPGAMGEALEKILELAAHGGRLVTLEIRSGEGDALALPWELLSFPRHPFPVRQGLLEIVRRIPSPGADLEPARDPAPEIPPDHLSVLGFTAAPLEDQAPTVRLGAGGGIQEDSDLFWEREQERLLFALDSLVRERRGRLILPDTGDVEELHNQLIRKDRPRVLHLSCHGGTEKGRPVVFLEDKEGHRQAVSSEDLLGWIHATPKTNKIELLVLAACDTATPAGLTETLVRGGVQRVVGMQSAISDHGATVFAEAFYSALGRGADLPTAFRAGRIGLARGGGPYEWAIPVLTVSRDPGPLTTPEGTADPLPTPFEVAREDFKIAGVTYLEKGYVGRRETERRLRRAFERGDRAIVIHGLGGIGKSTLAARFLERRKEEGARLLIVNAGRDLAPAALLEEIARKLGVERSAAASAEEQFRADLQNALREVTPTILLLDNFEDQQDQDGNLRNPDLGNALADLAVLGGTGFRLFFTSRLPVELHDAPFEVYNLDLGELSRSGCRKLRFLDPEGLGSLQEDAWRQVLDHLGGHPKALELLGGYLRGKPDRARTLLKNFGPVIQTVDRKLAAKHQDRGRSLLIETVLSQVPPERLPTFDRLCLLEEPLPAEELEILLSADGISDPVSDIAWLRDHGLLARKVSQSAIVGGDAVHRLLSSRPEQQNALANREGEEATRAWHLRVAEHFEKREGPLSDFGIAARHRDRAEDRAGALEDYNQWAIGLRERHAYTACIQTAREGLVTYPPRVIEEERIKAAALWLRSNDGLRPLGAIAEADHCLEQALTLLTGSSSPRAIFQLASTRLRKGGALIGAGRVKEAEAELQLAAEEFASGGHSRDRAIALGDIARLRAQSGDVAGALKLHEEMTEIFEQLGDVRSRAVTLGDIARLRAQSGDVAGALKLHEEELRTYEQLGDVRSRAVTLGDIARLRAQSGDVAGALKLHEERMEIFEQLGDVRSRAVTLGDIAHLRAQSGDVAEARKLQTERLEVHQRIGDLDGIANTQYLLAQLDLDEQKYQNAFDRLSESWQINLKLGRADGIAIVGQLLGSLLASAGMSTEAATVLGTAKDAFQRLGWQAKVKEIEALLASLPDSAPPSETEPATES
ncbi:MAG TPA: tetratricopeptide repeat protein [Thermoanaerobaculia bacterium]